MTALVANDLVVSFSGNTLTVSLKHDETVLATESETLPFSGMLNGTPTYAGGTITFPTRAADGTASSVSVNISGLISELASTVSALQSTKYEKPSGGIPSSDFSSAVQATLSNADADHATIPILALTSESGHSISFSVNTSTYVLTAQLLNKAGTVLSEQTVDLPLESVVVSGSYDDTTKKVTLTLVSGSTVEFSIADLISGLVSTETFTAHTGDTTAHITATERATWNNKADKNGVYDEMTVGTAKQILATVGVVEKVPYNFRTSAGTHDIGGNRETDKIIGGTVVWNQLARPFTATYYYDESSKRSFSDNDNSTTYVVQENLSVDDRRFRLIATANNYTDFLIGHIYLLQFLPVFNFNPGNFDWIFELGFDTLNIPSKTSGTLITTIFSPTESHLHFKTVLRCDDSISAAPGDSLTTSNYQIFDLTKMFGSTIANYIYSLETTNEGDGIAWFRTLFPKAYYSYNAGQLMSVKTSSHDMVGFNAYNHATGMAILLGGQEWQITGVYTALSYVDINGDSETITPDANGKFTPTNNGTLTVTGGNDTDTCVHLVWSGSRDGEYEPYVKHSYPLDSTLELQGFLRLATDNSLYYDGDEYEGSGTVTRKTIEITIAENDIPSIYTYENVVYANVLKHAGTTYYHSSSLHYALIEKYGIPTRRPSGITNWDNASLVGNAFYAAMENYFWIGLPAGTTLEQARAELVGKKILYERATEIIESAEPFANPQIVDDYGTEQYVDDREVTIPVGHETLYQANLRDKLQHLPSLYSVNGVVQSGLFHIQQDGTNMALAPDTSDARLNALEALVPVYEDYTIATTDWTALSSSDPYDYSATVTATHTIGSNTVVELVNNNPVLFATHGFAIGAVSEQTLTIYSIGEPDASVSLEVSFNG